MSAPPPPTALAASSATSFTSPTDVEVKAEVKKENKDGVVGAFEVTRRKIQIRSPPATLAR